MSVTPHVYGLFLQSLVEGRVNMVADPVWCMLVGSGYVFNQNSHKFKSVVTGELAGSGYTANGQHVTISTSNYDSTNRLLTIPAGNLVWPSVTWTGAKGAILYMNPDGFPDSAKPLIAYMDFGGPVDRSSQAFYLNWPATGILKLAVPA
jgi:hypothetical protein